MLDWKQRIDVMMNFNHSRCIAIDRMDTYVSSILWPTSLDTKLMVTFSNYHLRSRFDTNLVYIKIDTNLVLLGYKKSLKLWWVQFFQTVFEFSPFPFWQTIRMLIFFFQSLYAICIFYQFEQIVKTSCIMITEKWLQPMFV